MGKPGGHARAMERIVESGTGVRKVRLEYSFEWIKAGWRLTRANYGLMLATVGMVFAGIWIAVLFDRIPGMGRYLGIIVTASLGALISAGSLTAVRDLVEGRKCDFSRLFVGFTDGGAILRKALPFIATGIAFALLQHVLKEGIKYGDTMVWFTENTLSIVMGLLNAVLFTFSLPQILFEDRPFPDTILLNLAAVRKNVLPLLAYVLLIFTLLAVSLAALVLPFIFVASPILMTQHYLMYASIFGNLSPRTVAPATEPLT